jgi:hypothetical protein
MCYTQLNNDIWRILKPLMNAINLKKIRRNTIGQRVFFRLVSYDIVLFITLLLI